MFFPISGVTASPWLLILVGFTVGVCGGFFGVGGAFIATPALNILGFPMAYAIGTDLAHIMGKSLMATSLHRRLGNVDVRAAAILVAGTIPGVEAGARVVLWLEGLGALNSWVRWTYVFFLTSISILMIAEVLRKRSAAAGPPGGSPGGSPGPGGGDQEGGRLARAIQRIRFRPLLSLPASGIRSISLWVLLGIGLATGFLAGFLGVGGGFIRVPSLVYLAGMPTKIAVGTDLLEVFFSGAFGTFTYAVKGRVDIMAALLMLAGAAGGTFIGVIATRYATGDRIRLYFAVTMFLTAGAVFLKQMGYAGAAMVLLFTTAAAMSLVIVFILGAGSLRRGESCNWPAGDQALAGEQALEANPEPRRRQGG